MLFGEVQEQLNYGHKIRRSSWPEGHNLRLYVIPINGMEAKRGLYLCTEHHKEYFKPEQEDMLATDWEYGRATV